MCASPLVGLGYKRLETVITAVITEIICFHFPYFLFFVLLDFLNILHDAETL